MLNAVKDFSKSYKNGLFINSCFAHCQTERQDTWFSDSSPVIRNKVNKQLTTIYKKASDNRFRKGGDFENL